jgi:hypothetical protein
VGDDHQRRAGLGAAGEQQLDDPVAGLASRLPVGSSANTSGGRGTVARAMATRCCSPPESCAG